MLARDWQAGRCLCLSELLRDAVQVTAGCHHGELRAVRVEQQGIEDTLACAAEQHLCGATRVREACCCECLHCVLWMGACYPKLRPQPALQAAHHRLQGPACCPPHA